MKNKAVLMIVFILLFVLAVSLFSIKNNSQLNTTINLPVKSCDSAITSTYFNFNDDNFVAAINNRLDIGYDKVDRYKTIGCDSEEYVVLTENNERMAVTKDDFSHGLAGITLPCPACILEKRESGSKLLGIFTNKNELICESLEPQLQDDDSKCIYLKDHRNMKRFQSSPHVVSVYQNEFSLREDGRVISSHPYKHEYTETTSLRVISSGSDGRLAVFFVTGIPWGCTPQTEKDIKNCETTLNELNEEFRKYGGIWTINLENKSLNHIWSIPHPIKIIDGININKFDPETHTMQFVHTVGGTDKTSTYEVDYTSGKSKILSDL